MTIHIQSLNEYFKAISDGKANGRLVVMYFYSDNCAPCKLLKPVLNDLYDQYRLKADVYKIDIDKNNDIADFLYSIRDTRIRSIPTLKFFIEGTIKDVVIGYDKKLISAKFSEWSQYK
jgi:thioredoxin 1